MPSTNPGPQAHVDPLDEDDDWHMSPEDSLLGAMDVEEVNLPIQREGQVSGAAVLPYPVTWIHESPAECTLNLVVSLMGPGLLAMPWGFAKAGIIPGVLALSAAMLASRYTLHLVLKMSASALQDKPSLLEIGKRLYGKNGLVAVLVAYLLLTIGLLVSYLVVLADTLSLLGLNSRFVQILLALCCCAPSALARLEQNTVIGGFCLVCLALLVQALLFACYTSGPVSGPRPLFGDRPLSALAVFVLQSSAQAAAAELLPVAGADGPPEGDDAPQASALPGAPEIITLIAFTVAWLLLLVIGAGGYFKVGPEVSGNILAALGADAGILVGLAQVAYSGLAALSFGYVMVPCRVACADLLSMRRRQLADVGQLPTSAFGPTTGAVLLITFCAAWLVSDLGSVLELTGASAGSLLVLVLPSLFSVELRRRQEGVEFLSASNAGPLLLVLLGCILPVWCMIPSTGGTGAGTPFTPDYKELPGASGTDFLN